jgi:nicotinate-nucleotide adenylyltransferase
MERSLMQPLGLFGGSFDPPHLGHVALVQAALDRLQLPQVWVIPVGNPVHRQLSGRANAITRLDWMQRIFADTPGVVVQDWEVRRTEPSPTIDTLRRIHREQPACSPVLLLGTDAFAGIDSWVGYPEHHDLCDVAVFSRAGEPPLASHHGWQPVTVDEWHDAPGSGRLLQVDQALPEISATEVRERAVRGETLSGLVPECVRHDIESAYSRN